MPQDVSTMTVAELRAEFRTLGTQLDPIANRRGEIERELKLRMSRAQAKARLEALSDDEKAALFMFLKQELR